MSYPSFRGLLSLGFILGACLSLSGAYAQETTQKDGVPRYVDTKLVPEFDAVIPGQTLTIAIDQTMVDGWHTYWKNPGDSGEATNITWKLPSGWQSHEILFPTPVTEQVGPLMNYGYANHATLLTTLTPPAQLPAGSVTLSADVTWLVCSDICVPEQKHFDMTLPVATGEAKPTDTVLFDAARKAMPENVAWQGMVEEQDQNLVLSFLLEPETLAQIKAAKDIYFFPEDWGVILYAAPQNISFHDNHFVMKVQRDTRPLSDLSSLKGILAYTITDGTHKSVIVDVPLAKTSANSMASSPSSSDAPLSLTFALALAFLGGLILNLMPCVFPVLSIKALSLIKMSAKEQRHANLHGIFYTLGILTCFVGVAGALIALQTAGEQIGWGFQLQNPVIVLLLAYLLFVMGLNLSGFFEFKGHIISHIGHKLTAHHGYQGTFFTGMLATIVATPCTAPFMGTAMGYALTQSAPLALSVFIALGLGLAFPYLLLCFVPALRKCLPKPGAWMETFRQFMAFPLYASVAWLIWVYAQQVTVGYGLMLALGGLILIAFSIWIVRHTPSRQPWKTVVTLLSFLALFLAFSVPCITEFPARGGTKQTTEMDFPHQSFTKDLYDKLLAGDEPLFIDMTASWCITCKVNEKVALSNDDTLALFKAKNVRILVGDWTNRNPEVTEFLRANGRSGVPLYVYIGPRDLSTGQRPAPIILPQLLTYGMIADTITGTAQND